MAVIIAVDFDGTLCKNLYPDIGEPRWAVINYIKECKSRGSKLILWTCRGGSELQQAVDWCQEIGLDFDAVNDNLPEQIEKWQSNPRKVSADLYIDDMAVSADDIPAIIWEMPQWYPLEPFPTIRKE